MGSRGWILHIELRRWADIVGIILLSAISMATVAAGLAESLLLPLIWDWDTTGGIEGSRKKCIVAMHTAMWRHPITRKHVQVLKEDCTVNGGHYGWTEILRPVEKTLACGDTRNNTMRE